MTDKETHFLQALQDTKTPVHIFLTTGIKLTGRIKEFDGESLFLDGQGAVQMVYRHSVVTVAPAKGLTAG